MRKQVDLLNGPIFPTLTGLALPIMATSLVQMAYNLTPGRRRSGIVKCRKGPHLYLGE